MVTNKPLLVKLSLLSLLTLSVGCNEKLKQYSYNKPQSTEQRPGIIEDNLIASSTQNVADALTNNDDTALMDKIARENSQKPILYKQGAAGVSFSTTLQKSRLILSKPIFEKKDGNDIHTVYKSGVYIVWSADRPQLPRLIMLDRSYKGALAQSEEKGIVGDLKMGQDISKYFSDEDPAGEEFANALYRQIENKESDYKCTEEFTCSITVYPTVIVYDFKNLLLLVSGDRKIISQIRLVNNPSIESLNPEYDATKGSIVVENGSEISHGMEWGSVKDIFEVDGLNKITHNQFGKSYGMISLGLSKSNYDRNYELPAASEKVNATVVGTGYLKPIKFNEKFLDADTFELKIEKPANPLSLETELVNHSIANSAFKLAGSFKKSLEELNPENKVVTYLSGVNNENYSKSIGIAALSINEKEGSIKSILSSISSFNKKLSYFATRSVEPSLINQIVLPHFTKPIDLNNSDVMTSIAGFKIGDKLTIKEIDVARTEATLEMVDREKSLKLTDRVLFNYNDGIEGIYDETARVLKYPANTIYLNNFNIYLDMILSVGREGTHKIVGIGTSEFYAGISNLCSSPTLSFVKGESVDSVTEKISNFKLNEVEKSEKCPIHSLNSNDGQNTVSKIYFPKHRLVLMMAGKSLSGLRVYSNPEEVK